MAARRFETVVFQPFLKIRITFTNVKALGNLLKKIERLQISVTGLARTLAPSFRNLPGSQSMPVAFAV